MYEVVFKTKYEYVFSFIPVIKIEASSKGEAEKKAMYRVINKLNFRREAIEVVEINEIN